MSNVPNRIFDNFERSFIVRFSFLEHDLILFLQQREYSLATKHIQTFCNQMYGPLHHISAELLKHSLLALIGDLASCGFASHSETLAYVQLRMSLAAFWDTQVIDQAIFLANLQPTFDDFYQFLDSDEQPKEHQLVTNNSRNICAYVNLHLEDKITVAQIIHELQLSPSSAPKKFKNELGRSISSYLQRRRITLASYWLTETKLSISQIAQRLQFYDSASFSRQFKKVQGNTPSQYRQRN